MTALTPREIMLKQSDGSVAKAEGSIGKLFLLAMMAGAFIALGAQGSLMASFNLTSDPSTFGIGKVVMGAVFPVGLMMVVMCVLMVKTARAWAAVPVVAPMHRPGTTEAT